MGLRNRVGRAARVTPPDARQITIHSLRGVWETMRDANPPSPAYPADRLPSDLVSFAAAKGSLGALMGALSRWGLSDLLEKAERERARLALARTAMATAAMQNELGRILSACRKRGIGVVLFKGHDLIASCYHDDVLRPVTDADLLVRADDYPGLSEVLTGAGYRRNMGGGSTVWSRGGLIIDVHFGFVGDTRNPASAFLPRIGINEIFNGSRRGEIAGVSYLSPDPCHSLIVTALHALTHSYLMDFWFMDAGALLAGNDSPSFRDRVVDTARRHRLSGVLDYHLWSIRDIFGYPGGVPLAPDYRPPLAIRRLIGTAVRRTDYLFFGDILLGFSIDSHRKKFYYFKEMAFPHREVIAREMGVNPRDIPGVYRARLLHLVKSAFRVLFPGRR
jgi:hypothetical protein